MKKRIFIILTVLILVVIGFSVFKRINLNTKYEVGQKIDEFNNVAVYFNGGVGHVSERNLSDDGYNIGLKYQCVEFVKRYYYEALNHKMPDSYGNAKDFFDSNVKDGNINKNRDLTQYTNPSKSKPKVNDLVVYSGTLLNRYGHVSIVSKVTENQIEIIQQNSGPFGESREKFDLLNENEKWIIQNDRILGWLRK